MLHAVEIGLVVARINDDDHAPIMVRADQSPNHLAEVDEHLRQIVFFESAPAARLDGGGFAQVDER